MADKVPNIDVNDGHGHYRTADMYHAERSEIPTSGALK